MSIGEVLAPAARRVPGRHDLARSASSSPRGWSSRSAPRRATASSPTATSTGCATCWPRSATTTCRCGSSRSTWTRIDRGLEPPAAAGQRRRRRRARSSPMAAAGRRRVRAGAAELRLTRDELLDAAGLDAAQLGQLEQFGLVAPRPGGVLRRRRAGRSRRPSPRWPGSASSRGTCARSAPPPTGRSAWSSRWSTPLVAAAQPARRGPAPRRPSRELAALSVRLHAALVKAGLRAELGG